MRNRAPYIVLLILIIALVFFGGTRYGREVERYNKTVDYIISLTPPPPSKTPIPTQVSVQYKIYSNKTCPVSFLYPSYLKPSKESSRGAEFVQNGAPQLVFSCETKKPEFPRFQLESEATEAAKTSTANGRRVYFKLSPDLLPLIESSIKYSAK